MLKKSPPLPVLYCSTTNCPLGAVKKVPAPERIRLKAREKKENTKASAPALWLAVRSRHHDDCRHVGGEEHYRHVGDKIPKSEA